MSRSSPALKLPVVTASCRTGHLPVRLSAYRPNCLSLTTHSHTHCTSTHMRIHRNYRKLWVLRLTLLTLNAFSLNFSLPYMYVRICTCIPLIRFISDATKNHQRTLYIYSSILFWFFFFTFSTFAPGAMFI